MRKNKLITEGNYTDLAIAFYIAKKFTTKFENWAAFELGIIDEKGKILKKRLTTREERNAFSVLDKMILKVRTLIGDNLFLKIASAGLLLADHKPAGKLIEEQYSNLESQLFKKIQEQVLESGSELTIPLESYEEEIRINYETNELKDKFNLLIGVFLQDDLVSGLGGNYLPNNQVNQIFLNELNYIINNLDIGGNKVLNIQDDKQVTVQITVNYNSNEIKMQKVIDDEGLSSSILGDFYIIFNDDKEAQNFVNGWNIVYIKIEENKRSGKI